MSSIGPVVDVVDVAVLGRYVLELRFADGSVRVIDLEPMLDGPMYADLLADYDLFRQARADADSGTVVWPNGADISPRRLYAESKPKVPA